MRSATLRESLNQVRTHPPRKLNSSLISEIHDKCTSAEDLDDLLASSFFATVAWRFFHADITNSHLELILQVSTYEYEALCRSGCVETMKRDPRKLNDLLSRILQSTMAYRKQDSRLQACIFLFLRVLVVWWPSILEEHPLFEKWSRSVFSSYTKVLANASEGNSEMSSLLHCFLSFCLATVVSKSDKCRKIVHESWLPFHFMKEEFDFITQRLAALICLLVHPHDPKQFTSFEISIEKLGLQGKVPSAEFAPSRYDVSTEDFVENLGALSKDEIVKLAEWAGCRKTDESLEFLVSVITTLILGTGLSYSKLQNLESFTEQDVFDLFDAPKLIPFIPSPTFPSFIPLSTDYLAQIEARSAFDYLKTVNLRAESVLARLTITDSRAIKGTSKYFSEISGIEVSGSKAHIIPKNKKIGGSLQPKDVILLLEIQKPNRHGGVSRVVKNGISACSLTRVHSSSDGIHVEWNTSGFEERYNAFIIVPAPLEKTQEYYQQSPLTDTLAHIVKKDTEKATKQLSVDCIEQKVLETICGESVSKKRKLDDNQAETTDSSYTFNGCNVKFVERNISSDDSDKFTEAPEFLSEEVSRALLTMFSEKASVIDGLKGPENNTLINAFLRTLSINWADETCLVVVPTKAAADLVNLEKQLLYQSFKCDSNNWYLFRKGGLLIASLEQASGPGIHLGSNHGYEWTIRHALWFYQTHVEPTWKKYLKSMTKENFLRYDLDSMEYPYDFIDREPFERGIKNLAEDYSWRISSFTKLAECVPLDKFNLHEPKTNEVEQIREFFRMTSKYVVVSEDDLAKLDRDFDNVIVHNVSSVPLLRGGFKRLAIFGDSTSDWPARNTITSSQTRAEIARLLGGSGVDIVPAFNPGFRYCVQHIKVPDTKDVVNVEEAQFCVYLYQYMRFLGYPWERISIAVKSEHMRVLIEEILVDQDIIKSDKPVDCTTSVSFGWPIIQNLNSMFSSDHTIVSCHGSPTIREYQEIAEKSRKGFYLVGSGTDYPYKIKTDLKPGELGLAANEVYESQGRDSEIIDIKRRYTERRDTKNFHSVSNAAQLREVVEELGKSKKVFRLP